MPGLIQLIAAGAGGSNGGATDAYEGEGGRLDVEAAVTWLTSQKGCALDPSKILLVGASNGSTSILDYSVAHASDLPAPAAISWMSPGTYTENQHAIADHRGALDTLPIQWLYPTNEPYSEDYLTDAPSDWQFTQRGTVHGTRMFDEGDLEADTMADMVSWFITHAD